MMLWFAPAAYAGLLDSMDPASRHLAGCQQAASDALLLEDDARVVGVWSACLAEAERLGYADIVPGLRVQVEVSRAEKVARPLWKTDPHHAAMSVLKVAARSPSVELPTDAVPQCFRAWMQTDEGRGFVEDVRSVSVVWEGGSDPTADALLRRAVEDVGLKWASPGSPDADTLVGARMELVRRDGEGNAEGQLVAVDARLVLTRVRVPSRGVTQKAFTVSASAESPSEAEARDAAIRAVTRSAADRLLVRVLGVVLGD